MRTVLLVLAVLVAAPGVSAQTAIPPASDAPPAGVEFFSRFDSAISIERLSEQDERFVWDGTVGVDVDVMDYGLGRTSIVARYEVIMGREFRPFDPNQGNYILEASTSARTGPFELAAVFHHVSRHLSDRPKRRSVDWNMLGGRISRDLQRGRTALHGRADVRGVLRRGFVDYRWEVDTAVRARVSLRPRLAVVTRGGVRVRGVTGEANRGTQYGYRGEGGLSFQGRGATVDLFVAAERRIDPYQLELSTATWVTTGFRISGIGP
ncbi:MAG: hypothetical protein O2930_10605 [Acidobacteria bacterium]|nr:hypothetical protein [Acidobacteriota bacterium]